MTDKPSKEWVARIDAEHAALVQDEDALHNQELHKRILAAWKMGSPKMMARLKLVDPGLPARLARVLQARMWVMADDLMKGGQPVTDAREMAERETLMLEPESEPG